MESGTRARPWKALLLGGILGALLLAQEAACLRCYSCRDANDGGCAADFIKIEECAPPRNVCLEAVHVVTSVNLQGGNEACKISMHSLTENALQHFHSQIQLMVALGTQNRMWKFWKLKEEIRPEAGDLLGKCTNPDNQTLSVALKGCDVGTYTNSLFESGVSPLRSQIHACSEDLCNTLVTRDFIKRPDNGSKPSVSRDNECYSCLSTSEDQCSATKAAVVKCHGDEKVCYTESSTLTLGNLNTVTVPYFMKKCSDAFCSLVTTSGVFLQHNQIGSCCRGNLCNGVTPVLRNTTPPNTGLRPTTCVAHLILAAILAITSL